MILRKPNPDEFGWLIVGTIGVIILSLIFSGCALTDPNRTGLIRYENRTQFVPSTGMEVTPDGKYLLIHVPENYRLIRGTWVFALPQTFEVDTITVWQKKHGGR